MAITYLSSGLDSTNPAYNPVVYVFDSDNKALPGFRYVVDVYLSGTSTKIYEARIAPRPGDGYGYVDLSKILSSYVTYDADFTNTSVLSIPNSYIGYDVKVGEEYLSTWYFDDTQCCPTMYIQTGATVSAPFSAGDIINVTLTGTPPYFPESAGIHTVTGITASGYAVQVDIPFTSSPPNPGYITYADNRTIITRDMLAIINQYAFNSALGAVEWRKYDLNDYLHNFASGDKKLLLYAPSDEITLSPDDYLWIDYITAGNSSIADKAIFINDQGLTYSKSIAPTYSSEPFFQFSAGPNNVGALAGPTSGLITPSTEWYKFYTADSSGNPISKEYTILLDKECKPDPVTLVYQDFMGSIVSTTFNKVVDQSGQISRSTYNRQAGDLLVDKWTYDSYERGTVDVDTSYTREMTLSTGWLNEEQDKRFLNLLVSPNVWMNTGEQEFQYSGPMNANPEFNASGGWTFGAGGGATSSINNLGMALVTAQLECNCIVTGKQIGRASCRERVCRYV